MLLYLKQFFNEDEQKALLDEVMSYTSWELRDNNHHEHVNNDDRQKFVEKFQLILQRSNKDILLESLIEEKFSDFSSEGLAGMQASPMRYPTGKGLDLHSDTESKSTFFTSFLSFIIYLSKDYEGGNFFYLDEDGTTQVEISARMGDIIVVDPNFLHGAREVTSGNKYIATCHKENSKYFKTK